MTTTDIASLELEGVSDVIAELVETEDTLDGNIKDNGRAVKVGTRAFRIVMKYAKPGTISMLNLDGGTLPRGGKPAWNNGSVTPNVICIPVEWTKLVELVGIKAPRVAITDVVDQTMVDAAEMLSTWRDVLLQTDGTGTIATVSSVTTATPNVVTVNNTPFGARLIRPGQAVDIWNGTTLVTTLNVINVFNSLGGTQSFTCTESVSAISANYLVRINGMTTGAPVCINGLPVFNSTSTAGTVLGISRSNPYVVANGYDCGGAQISLPILRLIISQIKQRLGQKALKGQFFHTHTSQVSSYEELGFPLQTIPMPDGSPKGLDLLFGGKKSVDGFAIVENIHADQASWDFVQPKAWGKVKFGDPPFWYEAGGSRIIPLYDTSTGTPKTIFGAWLIDAYQNYVDNMIAGGRLSNAKIPTGN